MIGWLSLNAAIFSMLDITRHGSIDPGYVHKKEETPSWVSCWIVLSAIAVRLKTITIVKASGYEMAQNV